jgi:hypothetical protein
MLKNQIGSISFRNKRGKVLQTKPFYKNKSSCNSLRNVAYNLAKVKLKEYLENE